MVDEEMLLKDKKNGLHVLLLKSVLAAFCPFMRTKKKK